MSKRTADAAGFLHAYEFKMPERSYRGHGVSVRHPLYKAKVKRLAQPLHKFKNSFGVEIDMSMILKVKKMLVKGYHPRTFPGEAQTSLNLAEAYMERLKVTEAEVLDIESASAASVVSILRVDGDESKPVKHQGFVTTICAAMRQFFNVEFFSTKKGRSLDLTFYGEPQKTIKAAKAFEKIYNLTVRKARSYRGVGPQNSYCLGVSDELWNMGWELNEHEKRRAREAKKANLRTKMKEEKEAWNREHERREAFYANDYDSDSDYDVVDPDFEIKEEDREDCTDPYYQNLNDAMYNVSKKTTTLRQKLLAAGKPRKAHAPFRHTTSKRTYDDANKPADDYIKRKGIELNEGKPRTSLIRDQGAYLQGTKDARDIDVQRHEGLL